jgi:hypothetical protein
MPGSLGHEEQDAKTFEYWANGYYHSFNQDKKIKCVKIMFSFLLLSLICTCYLRE